MEKYCNCQKSRHLFTNHLKFPAGHTSETSASKNSVHDFNRSKRNQTQTRNKQLKSQSSDMENATPLPAANADDQGPAFIFLWQVFSHGVMIYEFTEKAVP